MTRKEWLDEALKTARDTHDRGVNLADMEAALGSLCEVAAAELLNAGGEISLPGLGKLKTRRIGGRKGRNPRTGQEINVPARNKVVFVAGQDFKAALKG